MAGIPVTSPRSLRRELAIFLIAAAALGISGGIFETTFNNFLSDSFSMTPQARGRLEFPRELPGFLVTMVGGALFFLSVVRLGVLSCIGIAAGIVGLMFVGENYALMIAFMVIWSAGNHLMMPVHGTIALSLAPPEQRAARIGQIAAIGTAGMILGAVVVIAGLQYLDVGYNGTFLVAAVAALSAAMLVSRLRPLPAKSEQRPKIVWKRRYNLFYILYAFSGARKQVFITFGVWVLIKVFEQPAEMIAKLWIVAGLIGIVVQPQIGRVIDRFGERAVLMANSLLMIGVCLGYGFANALPLANPVHLVYVCYVLDNILFATGMARTTYLDKIAENEDDIHASLSLGVTIDHAVSMSIPALGGWLWAAKGFPYVFVVAAILAAFNLMAAGFIRIPKRPQGSVARDENQAESTPGGHE